MQIEDKFQILKKRVVKFAIINALIIIITSLFCLFLNNLNLKNNFQINDLNNNINSIKLEINDITKKIDDASKAKKLWTQINQTYKKRQGLEIDKAKIILDDLQRIYNLPKSISVDLSTPIELTDLFKTNSTVIMSSNVNLNFSTNNDILAYQFIDSIEKNFPGFIVFKQLNIVKSSETIENIEAEIKNDKFSGIVNVGVIFQWQDFKDLEKKLDVNQETSNKK